MVLQELITLLGYELDDKDLKKSEKRFQQYEKNITNGFMNIARLAGKAALAAGALFGALTAGSIFAAGNLESLEGQFEVLLGSAEKGRMMMESIREMGARTPFQTEDFARGAQTMLAFGIEAEKILPYLRQIGDIAGRDAEKMRSLILAFSQIQSTGRLMGQDLLQLINAGFNPLTVISEQTGKSVATLKDEMSKGAISAEAVAQAFKIVTSEGGRFYKNMETQSGLLFGLFSTLKDIIELVGVTWGKTWLPALKTITKSVTDLFLGPINDGVERISNKLLPSITKLGKATAKWLDNAGPKIVAFFDLIEAGIDQVKMIRAQFKAYLTEIEPLLQVLRPIFGAIVGALKLWLEFQTKIWTNFWKGLAQIPLTLSWVIESVKAVHEAFRLWFWDMVVWWGQITAGADGFVQAVKDRMTILIAGIKREFGGLVDFFKMIAGAVAVVLEGLWKLPRDLFLQITKPLIPIFNKVIEWIAKKLEPIMEWIRMIPGIDIKLPPFPKLEAVLSKPQAELQKVTQNSFKQQLTNIKNIFKTEVSGMGKDGQGLADSIAESQKAAFSIQLQKVLISSRS